MEEEETLQAKPLTEEITPSVQKQVEPEEKEEDEEIQLKSLVGPAPEITPKRGRDIQSFKEGGQPLSENDRTFFELRLGYDFSRVRVHTDTQAAESARMLNAKAFTVGQDVVFGAGHYAPRTEKGRKPLTHVVQQSGKKTYNKKSNE